MNEILNNFSSLTYDNNLSGNSNSGNFDASSANRKLNNLRNTLNDKIKGIGGNIDLNNINNLYNLNDDKNNLSDNSDTLKPEEIKPNVEVFVTTLNQNATVLSGVSRSNTVQIQVGAIKMNIDIKYLRKPQKMCKTQKACKDQETYKTQKSYETQKNSASTFSGYVSGISKTKSAKSEINVIGLNVEEAIFVVDKFLDDCSLAKLQTVRIIHGKGTGKLKDGIHRFLKSNPHVSSFRLGTFGEGEMGVTVVELN